MTVAEKKARQRAREDLRESKHVAVVEIQGFAEACGYGSLDDYWDKDGDSIYAHHIDAFWMDGHPAVSVQFPQGTDPQLVARMLRKMAGMLEGSAGPQIANLGLLHNQSDYARHLGDGVVGVGNFQRDYAEYKRQQENKPDQGDDLD